MGRKLDMRHLLEFLKTREIKEAKENDIQAKMAVLNRAWNNFDMSMGADMEAIELSRKHLDEMYQGLNEEWLFLRQNKEWMFNFKSGGWNTMMAGDMETAIERAIAEYAYSSNLEVNPDTFKLVSLNRSGYEAAMRNFD